jgi:hypothetical protein
MKSSEIKIGVPVIYWAVIKENGDRFYPTESTIRSEAWMIAGGEIVCKIEGKAGGVSIKNLEKLKPLTETGTIKTYNEANAILDKMKKLILAILVITLFGIELPTLDELVNVIKLPMEEIISG